MSSTTFQPHRSTVTRNWHLVDAKGQVLGRVASKIARTLMGKGKAYYAPHVDCGDYVVVINSSGVRITGNSKPTDKIDFRHSGYPGGHTMTPYKDFLKEKPDRAISLAVAGMLPKNKLRPLQLKRLKVFKSSSHPHGAQFATRKKPVQRTEGEKHVQSTEAEPRS